MRQAKVYDSAAKRLDAYVRANDMRPSRVRNRVLECACNLHQPFTAEQLINACTEDRISKGTVYNALDLFVKADIIRGSQRQRGHIATEYEILMETAKHMQLICRKCGRVSDFTDKALSRLIEERKYVNFSMHQYSLIVYGECRRCKMKTKVLDPTN